MKIALSMPIHGKPETLFMLSAMNLILHTARTRPDIELVTNYRSGSDLCTLRHQLLKQARQCDYMLWMDVDHTFPPDALLRLLAHGVDAVGCNYRRRAAPYLFTAAKDGTVIETTRDSPPLEQVDQMGLGLCLIRVAALEGLGYPLFQFVPGKTGDANHGEDHFFWQRLKPIRPHVDHALSLETGHITDMVIQAV